MAAVLNTASLYAQASDLGLPYEAENAAQLASAIATKHTSKIVVAVLSGRTFYGYRPALGIAKVQAHVLAHPAVNTVYVF